MKKPAIAITSVSSSSISGHGYDPTAKTLAVIFKSGGATYHYEGVSQEVYDRLKKAKSVGGFVQSHIIGKYTGKKIGGG